MPLRLRYLDAVDPRLKSEMSAYARWLRRWYEFPVPLEVRLIGRGSLIDDDGAECFLRWWQHGDGRPVTVEIAVGNFARNLAEHGAEVAYPTVAAAIARADAKLLAFCESFEPGGAPFPAPRNADAHERLARDANLAPRRRSLLPAVLFGVILALVLLNTGVYSGSDIGRLRWRFEHGRLALRFSELHGRETFYVAANSEPLNFAVEGRWRSSSDWSLALPLWIPLLLVGAWWVMAWRRPPRARTASRTSTSDSR